MNVKVYSLSAFFAKERKYDLQNNYTERLDTLKKSTL